MKYPAAKKKISNNKGSQSTPIIIRNKKPVWDDTVNDLSKYKLGPNEVKMRKDLFSSPIISKRFNQENNSKGSTLDTLEKEIRAYKINPPPFIKSYVDIQPEEPTKEFKRIILETKNILNLLEVNAQFEDEQDEDEDCDLFTIVMKNMANLFHALREDLVKKELENNKKDRKIKEMEDKIHNLQESNDELKSMIYEIKNSLNSCSTEKIQVKDIEDKVQNLALKVDDLLMDKNSENIEYQIKSLILNNDFEE